VPAASTNNALPPPHQLFGAHAVQQEAGRATDRDDHQHMHRSDKEDPHPNRSETT